MKKLFVLALACIWLFSSCKDREADPNVLPEATQSGENTGGAVIDGKIWVATKDYINPIGGLGTFCEKINNTTYIQIDLRNRADKSRIFLKAAIKDFELNKTYILSEDLNATDFNYGFYADNNNNGYSTQPNSIYIGKLKVTKLNLSNDQVVCGTFELKTRDHNGKVVEITDGRFDKKFD